MISHKYYYVNAWNIYFREILIKFEDKLINTDIKKRTFV